MSPCAELAGGGGGAVPVANSSDSSVLLCPGGRGVAEPRHFTFLHLTNSPAHRKNR